MEEKNICCQSQDTKKRGLVKGLLYGLIPHIFCIGFIVFSVIGATAATAIFKKVLLVPYFFPFLVFISFVFATLSAVIYLKRNQCFCASGIKNKWKYIVILYATTIFINLLLFFVVFPAVANLNARKITNHEIQLADLSMNVQIPCSGHASLIISEIEKDDGVGAVQFKMPNIFDIKYDPLKTTPEKISSLEIFKTYKAIIK